MAEAVTVFKGNIVHCTTPFTVHTYEKGFVAVRGKKIVATDNLSVLSAVLAKLGISKYSEVNLSDTQLLIPGLVDTHAHAPQYPNIGLGYDLPLLDWLNKYTYPLETRYKDRHFAEKVYKAVVRNFLAHGTTTACYFSSLHVETSEILVDAAIEAGQRAFVGKVNMNKLCPDDYSDGANEASIKGAIDFVKIVQAKNSDLVKPIITPRFALSCDMQLMKDLAKIAKDYDLNIQSHISENKDEVALVRETYPNSANYAAVYDEAGLLTPKTVMAHSIYLSVEEMELFAKRGTSVAHCPNSNNALQSGICDVRTLVHHRINVGLGTDISGGSFPSIVDAMKSCVSASIDLSFTKKDYIPLNCYDAFYLATLGGAAALALEDKIGNFDAGKEFDALIVDLDVQEGAVEFLHEVTPLELLQKFIYTGDDRNVVSAYVAGKKVK